MKLGIDARPLEHPRTGIGRYTKEIIDHIVSLRDWSIVLFSSSKLPAPWDSATNIEYRIPGIPTVAAFQSKVGNLTKRHGIDVFFGPRHQLPLRLPCPSVLTVHDMAWLKARKTMRLSGALVDAIFMPQAIRRATRIITVSNHTRSAVCSFMPDAIEKTRTIYEAPFTYADRSQLVDNVTQPFILAVGTQEPRKNYDRLLAAFKKASLVHPNHQLVIVGGQGWKTNLTHTITRLGLVSQVKVLNSAHDDQLSFLYQHCEFLAMPSLYEGFGLPLVEAMNFDKAILTSNNSAMREIASDAAVFVDPLSVKSIAEGLTSLMSNAHLREKLAGKAKVRKTLFSWSEAAEQTAQTIEDAFRSVS